MRDHGYEAGAFFIVIFILTGLLLNVLKIKFSFVISMMTALALTLIIYIPVIKKEKKSTAIVSVLLLILSIYIVFSFAEFLVIGPKGEQIPFVYIIANFRFENETISSHSWKKSELNFYKPRCYSEFYTAKYRNTSLEVSAFYYGFPRNPFHFLPKYLYSKLFCGITDSKTAYEDYKHLLLEKGFTIEENSSSFKATNETTIVYSQLDGSFLMVVKVDKDEEYLLERIKVFRERF